MLRALLPLVIVLLLVPLVAPHGVIVFPPSRNARDRKLPAFAGGRYPADFPGGGCNCGGPSGCAAGVAGSSRAGGNGQGCFWFSQGCSIGCAACDNATQHTHGNATCAHPMEPLLDAPGQRTVNRAAAAGSAADAYRYNTWRAPGHAPVNDPCGMAGGALRDGPGHAAFWPTPWAGMGDLGSVVLPPGPPTATWSAGSVVEVGWALRFNHGGGCEWRVTHAAFAPRPPPRALCTLPAPLARPHSQRD